MTFDELIKYIKSEYSEAEQALEEEEYNDEEQYDWLVSKRDVLGQLLSHIIINAGE